MKTNSTLDLIYSFLFHSLSRKEEEQKDTSMHGMED